MIEKHRIEVTVNGQHHTELVEARLLLSDFLRDQLHLTGTHVGCEHGVCGACTILVDGQPARACLMLAVQADQAELTTVEGLAPDGQLNPLQLAFRSHHALQCGFCTPGFLMSCTALLAQPGQPTDDQILHWLSGNLCRCTGYQGILGAVRELARDKSPESVASRSDSNDE